MCAGDKELCTLCPPCLSPHHAPLPAHPAQDPAPALALHTALLVLLVLVPGQSSSLLTVASALLSMQQSLARQGIPWSPSVGTLLQMSPRLQVGWIGTGVRGTKPIGWP